MNASSHPTVVEYAVRECFKHKTPRSAALSTAKKLGGQANLFVGGGSEILEIDPEELEEQIWMRMATRALKAISSAKPGYENWMIEGTLQEYGQKPTPRNVEILTTCVQKLSS